MGATDMETHALLELEVLWPMVKEFSATAGALAEAHDQNVKIRAVFAELENLPSSSERWKWDLIELKDRITEHFREEEEEVFPLLRKAMGRSLFMEFGERMNRARDRIGGTGFVG
jgi:iron-sulfur cluster repair protein YtfE (RIC family)